MTQLLALLQLLLEPSQLELAQSSEHPQAQISTGGPLRPLFLFRVPR